MAIDYVSVRIVDPSFFPFGYYDISDDVIGLSVTQGKSRQTDFYEPGSAVITLNNYSRKYDPLNTSSPLNGFIKPKIEVSITFDNVAIISGLVDNWNFSYDVSGESLAYIALTDMTSLFANQYLKSQTFPQELSGARVNRILSDDSVAWPTGGSYRFVDDGTQMLDSATIEDNVNVLEYLRKIEVSEQGQIFSPGTYSLAFTDNSATIRSDISIMLFADDGSLNTTFSPSIASIPYESLDVSYDTDLLYNRITITSDSGLTTAVANIADSQADYEIYDYQYEGVLYANSEKVMNLASYLGSKYGYPEYRFASLVFNAANVSDKNLLFSYVYLNNFAQVKFTPNKTGSAINKYVRIIGIQHEVSANAHYVTLQFESLKSLYLVLDDATYGKLDSGTLGL